MVLAVEESGIDESVVEYSVFPQMERSNGDGKIGAAKLGRKN